MQPPTPQSWLVTTLLTVDPAPSLPALRSAWQPNTLPPQQTDSHSTRAPPPSLARHSRTLQQQGERAAGLQRPNAWLPTRPDCSGKNHLAPPTTYPNPSWGYKDLLFSFVLVILVIRKHIILKSKFLRSLMGEGLGNTGIAEDCCHWKAQTLKHRTSRYYCCITPTHQLKNPSSPRIRANAYKNNLFTPQSSHTNMHK